MKEKDRVSDQEEQHKEGEVYHNGMRIVFRNDREACERVYRRFLDNLGKNQPPRK